MRTSGPFLPSGRRSASSSSGGSGPAAPSSRRSSCDHERSRPPAPRRSSAPGERVVHEQHVGVAAVAQLARRRAGPSPTTSSRVGERPAGRSLDRAVRRCRARPASVAAVRSVSARPTSLEVEQPDQVGRRRSGTARAGGRRAPPSIASSAVVLAPRPPRSSRRAGPSRGRGLQPVVVAEHGHRLRRAHAAGRRRTGCGPARAPAARRRCPRRAASSGTSASCRASSLTRAEGQQPGVGVGLVGEPAEHHRQQRALDRARRG